MKRQKISDKIEDLKFEFTDDDGYIYYFEFLYQIMKHKYNKLDKNIFISGSDSLFDKFGKKEAEGFDDAIKMLAIENINL